MDHADAISRYCLRRLPAAEVNDAVAEVFVVAWRKVEQMPDSGECLPWLYAVARNEVMKAKRAASRGASLRERVSRQPRDPVASPEPIVVRNLEAEQLMRTLATLRPADQEVLLLRTHEELTMAELAVALDCSVDAAKKRHQRALGRLRQAVAAGAPVSELRKEPVADE